MTETVKLSLIIPTHQRPETLFTLLDSIDQQDLDKSLYEVIVISNWADGVLSQEIKSWCPKGLKLRYFEVGRKGGNLARNLGIEKSKGDILYFLDDDCELHQPDILSDVLILHEDFPEYVGIGGKYVLPVNPTLVEKAYNWIQDQWLAGGIISGASTTALIGGNASFKKSVLGAELKFDDSIDFGGAETELNLRLILKGYKMRYVDELRVTHNAGINFRDLAYKGFKQGVSFQNRVTRGLVVPSKRRNYSPEELTSQYHGLNFFQRPLFYWLLSLFDYFFSLGVKAVKGGGKIDERPKAMLRRLVKAPHLKWFFKAWRVRILEIYYLIRLT